MAVLAGIQSQARISSKAKLTFAVLIAIITTFIPSLQSHAILLFLIATAMFHLAVSNINLNAGFMIPA